MDRTEQIRQLEEEIEKVGVRWGMNRSVAWLQRSWRRRRSTSARGSRTGVEVTIGEGESGDS